MKAALAAAALALVSFVLLATPVRADEADPEKVARIIQEIRDHRARKADERAAEAGKDPRSRMRVPGWQ